MTILKTLIASAILSSVALTANAQSQQELYDFIHPESASIFKATAGDDMNAEGIVSLNDDHNMNHVWSNEYEEYVNPGDFKSGMLITLDDVNKHMEQNPTAAGQSGDVFIYNEDAGEYYVR